eukprot:SAG31_NODE_1244_length_9137_cov_36.820978_1_plen_607_part_00
MASSLDLLRSSTKKKAAATSIKKAVLARLAREEGDAFDRGMELHRRTVFSFYGEALTDGWRPQEITTDWLAKKSKDWLGSDYVDDYFRLVWDGEMQPGLAASAQAQYTATAPQRSLLLANWPAPETETPDGNSDSDEPDSVDTAVERSLLPALHLAAGEVTADPESAPKVGKKAWKAVADDGTQAKEKKEKAKEKDQLPILKKRLEKYSRKLQKEKDPKNKDRFATMIQATSAAIMALKTTTTEDSDRSDSGTSQYPHKQLPNDMKDSWEFGVSNENVLDFIERMQDWLILAPPKLHTKFLLMALAGGTKTLFRKVFMEDPQMKLKEALVWLKANCTSRDSKQNMLKQMENLKMKKNETIQVMLTRATTLRLKLREAGVETDDFHFRTKIEDALRAARESVGAILTDVLKETGSQEYSLLKFFERLKTVEHAHGTSSKPPRPFNAAQKTEKAKARKAKAKKRKQQKLNAAAKKKAKTGKAKKTKDSDSDSDEEMSNRERIAYLEGQLSALGKGPKGKGQGGGKGYKGKGYKGGRGGWNTNNSWNNGQWTSMTEAYKLPHFAVAGHMEKFYTDDQWERRLKILDDGESPKDYPELFKLDRWDKRFVC